MKTKIKNWVFLLLVMLAVMTVVIPQVVGAGRGDGPVIYVTGQGLYYDSIVAANQLPPVGPFQKLEMGENGLETEFGPGDHGYVGGRWWIDVNGNGEMDDEDSYFGCPLLGPGRETP